MSEHRLPYDPYNLIITGVGGQGNVLASKVLANLLVSRGLNVTIGETFGASQRGGSVMSHLRISSTGSWSPLIPRGQAHTVVALEPIEALRVLATFGNPQVIVIANNRPVHPIGVICGDQEYPSLDQIDAWLQKFSRRHWLLPATDEAVKLDSPILANIILIGALGGTRVLQMGREEFLQQISATMPRDKVDLNLRAFDLGWQMTN
jgi:indolepyruvate ferredoxin oxidoreductase, beta subunit